MRRDTELSGSGVLPVGLYLSTFADALVVEYTLADGRPDPYRLLTTLLGRCPRSGTGRAVSRAGGS